MTPVLQIHGTQDRYVALDPDTGKASPCQCSNRIADGWAHQRDGTWYAGYRSDGEATIQVGRNKWFVRDVSSNVLDKRGLSRRLTLVFGEGSGAEKVEVSYLRPLRSYFDDSLDDDDAISTDFFVWLHRAIKEGWLEHWGDEEELDGRGA